MNYNIEDIKGFVRSQVDAATHLSGVLSARSFEIIHARTIKHFALPPHTTIALSPASYAEHLSPNNYLVDIEIPKMTPANPEKSKSKRLTLANSKIMMSLPDGQTIDQVEPSKEMDSAPVDGGT